MIRWVAAVIIFAAVCAQASNGFPSDMAPGLPCSDSWYRFIEDAVATGDDQGHGPDFGSDEWKSVIEFKLGIRGDPNLPARDSDAWCRRIDQIVREKGSGSLENNRGPDETVVGDGPSYNCDNVAANSAEEMICRDDELSALDRKLSIVYSAAIKNATNEHPPVLKAEQRGWIKGRNDCWKADDRHACVKAAYQHRIAELQARYRLVRSTGPVTYACDGDPANAVIATFFQTEPPTLIAERGDQVSLMVLQPSGSGSKYQGRNESLWEHGGEAIIVWGYGSVEMHCTAGR